MAQSTISRPPRPQQRKSPPPRGGSLESLLTLARWQLGTTWRLLLVADIGILALVALICLIPLYSSVATSAAFRDSLSASPANSYVVETATSFLYNQQKFAQFEQRVSQQLEQLLPGYVQKNAVFSTSLQSLTIERTPIGETNLDFLGFPEQQIPQHVRLVAGQFPQTAHVSSNTVPFMTTPEGFAALENMHQGYKIGSVFQFPVPLANPNTPYLVPPTKMATMSMKLVGVVALSSTKDLFWHGEDFQPIIVTNTENIPVLMSNEALGRALEGIEATPDAQGRILDQSLGVSWYYPLNLAHFNINNLDAAATGMSRLLSQANLAGDSLSLAPYIMQTHTGGPISIFQYFSERVTLLRVPVGGLALLIGVLILLFVSVVVGLLIEQQGEQVALLRGKGATRRQIVGALSAQGGLLALPALVLGPALAWVLALWLSQVTLQGDDRNAVDVLLSQPLASLLSAGWIALVVVVVALLVMALALWQKVRTTVLTTRSELARSGRPALWRRWRLDLVGAAVALVGAGFAFYLSNAGILNARTRALILPVVLLGAALGILVAVLLLLFRCLPALLRWGSRLALRGRGISAVLAVAQIARAPQRAVRMSMLLAFTLAFAIFTLTLNASQAQRVADATAFQVGSDFSGVLVGPGTVSDWQATEQAYAQIPGVLSAMIGHAGVMVNGSSSPVDVQAVDAGTCAQTMDWTAPDSQQEIVPLLRQLVARRQASINAHVVPAIVDASAANSMGLSVGSQFGLHNEYGAVNFVVIGQVQSIPGVIDDSSGTGTSDATLSGGILADYETLAAVQVGSNGLADEAESMWLKTSNDPKVIASIEQELNSGAAPLKSISDRRAITASLSYDPMEAAIEGSLLAGAAVALALGLIGSLFGSWTGVRRRMVNFAMMRALGNTSTQIVGVAFWEQGIIYTFALLLGIGGGLLFSRIVAPGLLYTPANTVGFAQAISGSSGLNMTGSGLLYLVQGVPAPQVVFPLVSILVVIVIVIVVCALALALMVRLVTRPALSEVLRLNED